MYGYDFHRQKPIDNYILDFYCSELNLGIELDGYSHEFIEVIEKDTVKTLRLKNLGITILRFSDDQVFNNMDNILWEIETYILKFEAQG